MEGLRYFHIYKLSASSMITLLSLRLLKLVQFQPHVAFFTMSLSECAGELFNFLFCFTLLFTGFSISGWFLFGQELETYGTLGAAFMTNLNFIFGDFDWDAMLQVAPIGAYLYFLFFSVVIFIILFNILLAIMLDGYEDAKKRRNMLGSQQSVTADLKKIWMLLKKCDVGRSKYPSSADIEAFADNDEKYPEDARLSM